MKKRLFAVIVVIGFALLGHAGSDLESGLIAHYLLDGDAADDSGYGNHGLVVGATAVADRFGTPFGALRFDGIDDFAEIPYDQFIDVNGWPEGTVAAWFRVLEYPVANKVEILRDIYGPSPNYSPADLSGIELYVTSDGSLGGEWRDGDLHGEKFNPFGGAPSLGAWHHAALVYSGDRVDLFLDGAVVSSAVSSSYGSVYVNNNLRFGSTPVGTGFFSGDIDDVRLYDRALSPAEVEHLYDLDSLICEPGNALEFDNQEDCATVPFDPSFPVETFTLAGWIRVDCSDDGLIIAYSEDLITDNSPWALDVVSGGRFAVRLEDSSDLNLSYDTGAFVADGFWHHVAATRNQSGTVLAYVDGNLVATFHETITPSPNSVQPIYMGCAVGNPQGPNHFFCGAIDEIAMWNRPLDGAAISDIYHWGIDPSESGLVGYWALDEVFGQAIFDQSPAANHGFLGLVDRPDPADPLRVVSEAPVCEDDCAARRHLPTCSLPNSTVEVVIEVNPPPGASNFAVEETPPSDWPISDISDGGVFDAIHGQVRWGPFFDDQPRELSYTINTPPGAFGAHYFYGMISVDGVSNTICGASLLTEDCLLHPADLDDSWSMDINEVTAFGAAWRNGDVWPRPPNPIPVDYVTNAGLLWHRGETFYYDPAVDPPWVPSQRGQRAFGEAVSRFSPSFYMPGFDIEVVVSVTPAETAAVYAMEDRPPVGWTVSNINYGGEFDSVNGRVKWGPFFDVTPRVLGYVATPLVGLSGVQTFIGRVSFDGQGAPLTGDRVITDDPEAVLLFADGFESGDTGAW